MRTSILSHSFHADYTTFQKKCESHKKTCSTYSVFISMQADEFGAKWLVLITLWTIILQSSRRNEVHSGIFYPLTHTSSPTYVIFTKLNKRHRPMMVLWDTWDRYPRIVLFRYMEPSYAYCPDILWEFNELGSDGVFTIQCPMSWGR